MKQKKWYAAMAAAALLLAATGCSDDLENSGGNNQPEGKGQTAYMSVSIARGTSGVSTKASSNGEGDEFLDEITDLKEDVIGDINIYLFKKQDTDNAPTNDSWYLKALNCTDTDAKLVEIDGHGYLGSLDLRPSGGNEPNHDRATVTVSLKDPLDDTTPKDYYVLTVVNAGNLGEIDNLKTLREKVSEKAWTGNRNSIAGYDKFVMSTHQMVGKNNPASIVSLSKRNTTEADAAPVTVYVERLAARVDLKIAENLGNNNRTDGTFTISRYLPVNLYKVNSYIFKQVTPTVTSWDVNAGSFSAALAGTYDQTKTYGFKYLGDEEWTGMSGTGTYNYVIDPKTAEKIAPENGDFSSFTQDYDNHFIEGTTELDPSDAAWKNVSAIENYDAGEGFKPIFYTKENTMSVGQQKHGFSTGVIFESEFTPNETFKVSKYNSENGKIEEVTLPEDNKTFLTATHGNNRQCLFANVKTIAAMAFAPNGENITAAQYKAFMDGEKWPEGTTLEAVQELINTMSESNPVETKFRAYLKDIVDAEGATFDTIKDELTYNKFCDSESGKALELETDEPISKDYIGTLYKDFKVSYYNGGKSYHKFWIRHDSNNNPYVMGVMEFVIVRNNVYQLNVTGVTDFGDPLPFTPGKDDPDNPDESQDLKILVNIFVKDWVNRRNADIIL